MKRAEVQFAPAEVETAVDTDFEKNPLLVKGYIGPWSADRRGARARSRRPASGTCSTRASPTARGWITGANADGKHVFGLVAGRDFGNDGTAEVAEVRAGDPAPDGSGPVELARGMEIGHVFQLGRKYAEALGPAGARRERQARHRHDGLVRHRCHAHPGGRSPRRTTTRRA